ncbi:MAG: isoprenylcysteine carboxylmethyltransferase family protein [Alphaproteobacteria bacterium]
MYPRLPLFYFMPHWSTIFWISYAGWALMEWWIFSRDMRAAQGEKKDAGSRLGFFLLLPIGIGGAFTAPYLWPWAHIALPAPPIFYTAIALIWVGMALRLWAVLTLGRFFRTSVFLHDEHKLITNGPYRVLRHPSYTGALISMLGVSLAMGNWLSIAVLIGCVFIIYAWRITVEERALAERFGAEYAARKRRTWAIIPFIW